jgi:crossover junction endodeoxyribonuclease RuvC
MFTFGHAAGVAEGILQGLNIPYTLVTPQAWKKSAGLIGSDKDAARSRAIQLTRNCGRWMQKRKARPLRMRC